MSGGGTRTGVEVDEALLHDARRAGGLRTEEETVEAGLRLLLRLKATCAAIQIAPNLASSRTLEEEWRLQLD